MKEAIHPKYQEALIRCTCGNEIHTRSTRSSMHLDVCNVCHPFFTGEQRIVDTAGRVERFNRRYQRPGQ
ncbi:MAG: 50S ribosomal protein L31 [Dehalococcoidia bacterium]